MWPRLPPPPADVQNALHLALRLTALALLLRPMGPDVVRALMLVIAATVLLFPRFLTLSLTWYALFLLMTIRIVADWPLADNHIYLIAYWCLAVALSRGSASPMRHLVTNTRLLVGLAFLMAVLWKGVLSSDYRDGRFFRVTLIADERLAGAARLLGGLTPAELKSNREALRPLPDGAELLDPPELVEPPAFRRLALALTWGALLGEGLVAVAFLAPPTSSWARARHALLIAFCATTYAVAPVAGFGWVLIAMGTALTSDDARRTRAAYVAVWLGVLISAEVPWLTWLADRWG